MLQSANGIILDGEGRPAYALLEYDLYLAHKAEIDAWRAAAGAQDIAELIAEAKRNREEIQRDPSRLTSHTEIKRLIAEKQSVNVAT